MDENEMKEKLENAGKKAEQQVKETRARTVKGAHLQDKLLETARDANLGLQIEEKSGFLQVRDPGSKRKKIYISKKGGRVDLSGFTLENPAVKQITEAEAQAKHLGKVRGTLDFDQSDEAVLAAFSTALNQLKVPEPTPVAATTNPPRETPPEQA